MFEYLKEFSDIIYKRYETVETNIKAKSNSFYDSWLDMLEQLLSFLFDKENLKYDKRMTCGQLLKDKALNIFLVEKLNYTNNELENLKSWVSRVNDHKHHEEQELTIDDVYKSLELFNLITFRYAKYLNIKNTKPISIEYYVNIFGESLKEHEELNKTKTDNNEIKTMLYNINEKIEQTNNHNERIAKQKANDNFSFKIFVQGSYQQYFSLCPESMFNKEKKRNLILNLITILIIFINTGLCIIRFKMFDTFSFILDIWAIYLIFLQVHTLKCKKLMNTFEYSKNNLYKFEDNGTQLFLRTNVKLGNKIFYILSIISAICLIIYPIMDEISINKVSVTPLSIVITVLEVISLVMIIIDYYFLKDFEFNYTCIFVTNKWQGVKRTCVYFPVENQLYFKDDLDKKYPDIYNYKEE